MFTPMYYALRVEGKIRNVNYKMSKLQIIFGIYKMESMGTSLQSLD
jgi:hypothetical protein